MHRHRPVPVSLCASPVQHDAPTVWRCAVCNRRVVFDDHGLVAPLWAVIVGRGFAVLWSDVAPVRRWFGYWWPLVGLWAVFVAIAWIR